MNYIFDTNAVSFLYDNSREPYHSNLFIFISSLKNNDNLYISIVTLYELEYSLSNSFGTKKEQVQVVLDNVLNFFKIFDLPKNGAKIFGELKHLYKEKTGASKETMKKNNIDFMIASTALINSCVVVSYDHIFNDISKINKNLRTEKF